MKLDQGIQTLHGRALFLAAPALVRALGRPFFTGDDTVGIFVGLGLRPPRLASWPRGGGRSRLAGGGPMIGIFLYGPVVFGLACAAWGCSPGASSTSAGTGPTSSRAARSSARPPRADCREGGRGGPMRHAGSIGPSTSRSFPAIPGSATRCGAALGRRRRNLEGRAALVTGASSASARRLRGLRRRRRRGSHACPESRARARARHLESSRACRGRAPRSRSTSATSPTFEVRRFAGFQAR